MKTIIIIFILFSLTGCLPKKEPVSFKKEQEQCFTIEKDSHFDETILLNKCTGTSFLLVKVYLDEATLLEGGQFTYRWHFLPLTFISPKLSVPLSYLKIKPKN